MVKRLNGCRRDRVVHLYRVLLCNSNSTPLRAQYINTVAVGHVDTLPTCSSAWRMNQELGHSYRMCRAGVRARKGVLLLT